MKDLLYSDIIREKIMKEIEKMELESPTYTNDLNTGLRTAKEIIISKVKALEL